VALPRRNTALNVLRVAKPRVGDLVTDLTAGQSHA